MKSSLSKKAQANVVGAVMIAGILVVSVTASFLWGVPLVQKNQDRATISTAQDALSRLNDEIVSVARQGGTRTVPFDLRDGFLVIDTDRVQASGGSESDINETDVIEYEAITNAAYVATTRFVPLNENDVQGTSANGYEGFGLIGKDKEGVLLGKADILADTFRTTMKIEYRLLREAAGNGFKIDLVRNGNLEAESDQRNIVISKGETHFITTSSGRVQVVEVLIRIE